MIELFQMIQLMGTVATSRVPEIFQTLGPFGTLQTSFSRSGYMFQGAVAMRSRCARTFSGAEVAVRATGCLEQWAPVLVLAGDIGTADSPTLQAFLAWAASRFELVLFLAGNHEYYGGEYRLISGGSPPPCTAGAAGTWGSHLIGMIAPLLI